MKVDFLIFLFLTLAFAGCKADKDENANPTIPEFVMAGGETTVFDQTSFAFSTPAPNLSDEHFEQHMKGDFAFDQAFVTPPAINNPGLGPVFNNNSCVSCHIKNGRSAPAASGDQLSGFLLRLSIAGENELGGAKAIPNFGNQLQNRAIFGFKREAGYTLTEIQELVTFLDGTQKNIIKPVYTITDPYLPLPKDIKISPRVAPAVFGLGLLEAIPQSSILAYDDEFDKNKDGISGKPNYVWNIEKQARTLGRFGWKAETPSAKQQAAEAFNQDMGITSSMFPKENCNGQPNCQDDGVIDIADDFLETTTFYFQTLAVPAMRNYTNTEVLKGKALFEKTGCSGCHVPKQRSGAASIPELSHQTIFPYTDLLLHDMGEGLADNRPIFNANGQEWRTPPLWGLGLMQIVNGHTRLLHDGRARNVEEAVLWHGGEAEASKKYYTKLSAGERKALLSFLNSL